LPQDSQNRKEHGCGFPQQRIKISLARSIVHLISRLAPGGFRLLSNHQPTLLRDICSSFSVFHTVPFVTDPCCFISHLTIRKTRSNSSHSYHSSTTHTIYDLDNDDDDNGLWRLYGTMCQSSLASVQTHWASVPNLRRNWHAG